MIVRNLARQRNMSGVRSFELHLYHDIPTPTQALTKLGTFLHWTNTHWAYLPLSLSLPLFLGASSLTRQFPPPRQTDRQTDRVFGPIDQGWNRDDGSSSSRKITPASLTFQAVLV
jgi:hypothetical protein